jgi:hypothetical protein
MAEKREYTLLTPNQVVAYNLHRARMLRGWLQEEAAEKLEPYLGVRWSKAVYSAAERSYVRSDRIRNFTADDIVAFAKAFQVPVTWFFVPPVPDDQGRIPLISGPDLERGYGDTPGFLLELVFGPPTEEAADELSARLTEVLRHTPPELQTPLQKQIARTSGLAALSVVLSTLHDLETWEHNLRDLADILGAARTETVQQVADILAEDEEEPEA